MHINFLFCYNRLQPMNAINWIMILAVVHKYTDESVVDETRIHLLAMKTNKKTPVCFVFSVISVQSLNTTPVFFTRNIQIY